MKTRRNTEKIGRELGALFDELAGGKSEYLAVVGGKNGVFEIGHCRDETVTVLLAGLFDKVMIHTKLSQEQLFGIVKGHLKTAYNVDPEEEINVEDVDITEQTEVTDATRKPN